MKKYYSSPEWAIKMFNVEDVIATSLQAGENENEEQWWRE